MQTSIVSQLTLAIQPELVIVALLLNLKVKHPSGLEDVNGPGIVVPQYPPAKPPGTFPPEFELSI